MSLWRQCQLADAGTGLAVHDKPPEGQLQQRYQTCFKGHIPYYSPTPLSSPPVCLSFCLSVSTSVTCLLLTQERKDIESSHLIHGFPTTCVKRWRDQRSRLLGLTKLRHETRHNLGWMGSWNLLIMLSTGSTNKGLTWLKSQRSRSRGQHVAVRLRVTSGLISHGQKDTEQFYKLSMPFGGH